MPLGSLDNLIPVRPLVFLENADSMAMRPWQALVSQTTDCKEGLWTGPSMPGFLAK